MKILILIGIFSSFIMAQSSDFYEIENTILSKFQIQLEGKLFDYKVSMFRYTRKEKSDKHILMSHGYLDNCGYALPIIKYFIDKNYEVTCIDLPGHGESSGRRGDIDSFDTYGYMYQQIIEELDLRSYKINVFYAHSTGNSGMIDLLLKNNEFLFNQYIMASPLVKSYLYGLSSFAIGTLGRFLPYIPRKLRNKQSKEFMAIYRSDPRPIKWLPLNWARRHMDWNNRIKNLNFESNQKLNLIFGTNDTVINAPYNESFLKKHFPKSKVYKVQKSGHHFIFQSATIKKEFYRILDSILIADSNS